MGDLISKELLSEVMEYSNDLIIATEKDIYFKNGYLNYEYQDPNCTMETYITIEDKINIYELAHKCKEWASTIKTKYGLCEYHITSSNQASYGLQTSLCPVREKACAYVGLFIEYNEVRGKSGNSWQAKYGTQAEKEYEAVIKCAEWIRKELLK